MALSMTGYGRGVGTTSDYMITIDLKAVNHRYLELYFKIPKAYAFLEDRLRREIASRISRGKLEIVVQVEKTVPEDTQIELNQNLAASYLKAINELQRQFTLTGTLSIESFINLPNLFNLIQTPDAQEQIEEIALIALGQALTALLKMRQAEGEGLIDNIRLKLNILAEFRELLLDFTPEVVKNYQERLERRIQELSAGIEIDPNRLATEIAIFADKSDITEELVRIESHLKQFLNGLKVDEPIGRKLDFIIQELNREINTVGSKANDLRISQTVIDFKVELEKIREQIQNIE